MPRKKDTSVDWKEIKGRYLAGQTTAELAKLFNVPESTIKTRAYRETWLSKEMSPRVINKVAKELKRVAKETSEQTWRERAAQVREKEYLAAQRILDFTECMTEVDLLTKVDKIKTAADMGRRAAGLDDKQTNANAINIAVLSDIDFLNSEARVYGKPRALEVETTLVEADKP